MSMTTEQNKHVFLNGKPRTRSRISRARVPERTRDEYELKFCGQFKRVSRIERTSFRLHQHRRNSSAEQTEKKKITAKARIAPQRPRGEVILSDECVLLKLSVLQSVHLGRLNRIFYERCKRKPCSCRVGKAQMFFVSL